MPRAKAQGLESYEDLPMNHPQRRKIQNRNAQRTFRSPSLATCVENLTDNLRALIEKRAISGAQPPVSGGSSISSRPQSSQSPDKSGADLQPLQESLDSHRPGDMDADMSSFLDHTPDLDTFLGDVELDDHSMEHTGQGSLQTLDQEKEAARQASGWRVSRANRAQSDDLLLKTNDNNPFNETRRHDPPFRSSSRSDLLNSPFPSTTSSKIQNRTGVQPSCSSDSYQGFISWAAPSVVSVRGPPAETSNISASSRLQNVSPINSPCQKNGTGLAQMSASGGTGLLSPSQTEMTLSTANLITASRTTSAKRRRSADTSPKETPGPSSVSSESALVWRHLIHTCCENGHLSLVEELVDVGLDIDKKDSAGNTPLHIAAGAGHVDIMNYLIEKGCNVNAINHAGWTAAHLASNRGHRRCLRLLLEKNVSPWARLSVMDI